MRLSEGQQSLLMWALIIMVVCYALDINLFALINNILHALQTMHQANAHH